MADEVYYQWRLYKVKFREASGTERKVNQPNVMMKLWFLLFSVTNNWLWCSGFPIKQGQQGVI